MKAETTKRLFKAIASNSQGDILKLCEMVISEEIQIGHNKLADQLKKILAQISSEPAVNSSSDKAMAGVSHINQYKANLRELPRDKRSNAPLANKITFQNLRHHMILPLAVEQRFQNIEKEFVARERLATYGLRYKKKILLYGAPGCGKTLGAERIAFNLGLPLIKVRFDAIISSYFGGSASNLRTVFESVLSEPCVLLLDECDFIAKSRDVKNDVGEIPRIVNMLLTLLDEYSAPGLLIATTNLERNLDSALFRRFDDVIEMPLPSEEEIERLFKSTLSALKIEKNIVWKSIATKMKGCSAAAIVKVSEEAAKYAILEGRDNVKKDDLLRAASEIYRGQ